MRIPDRLYIGTMTESIYLGLYVHFPVAEGQFILITWGGLEDKSVGMQGVQNPRLYGNCKVH